MKATRYFIVRHGQCSDNAAGILNGRRDSALTLIGMAQAHEAAVRLRQYDLRVTASYTSPLQRARATAAIITKELAVPEAVTVDDLIERDFGCMTGQSIEAIRTRCAPHVFVADNIYYFLHPEGAETFPVLLRRAQRVLRALGAAGEDGGDVLIVTHGDIGKMLVGVLRGWSWEYSLNHVAFGNGAVVQADMRADRKT